MNKILNMIAEKIDNYVPIGIVLLTLVVAGLV